MISVEVLTYCKSATTVYLSVRPISSDSVYSGMSCNSLMPAKHENEYGLKISPSWYLSQAILWAAVNSHCMSSNVWFIVLFWDIQIQMGFAISSAEGIWSIVLPRTLIWIIPHITQFSENPACLCYRRLLGSCFHQCSYLKNLQWNKCWKDQFPSCSGLHSFPSSLKDN